MIFHRQEVLSLLIFASGIDTHDYGLACFLLYTIVVACGCLTAVGLAALGE